MTYRGVRREHVLRAPKSSTDDGFICFLSLVYFIPEGETVYDANVFLHFLIFHPK